jgi:hypothetical protein
MVHELAEKPQYRTLEERSQSELQNLAEQLDLKLPKSMGAPKMAQAIRVKQTRLQLDAEQAAQEQRIRDKADPDKKPSFEEVLIFGGRFNGKEYPPSKRWAYRFINNLDSGQDFACIKGGAVFMHIYQQDKEGNPLLNVLPKVLCDKYPPLEGDVTQAEQQEQSLKRTISLQEIGYPIWESRADPHYPERNVPTIVGYTPRFTFIEVKEVPDNTPFGVYFETGETQ